MNKDCKPSPIVLLALVTVAGLHAQTLPPRDTRPAAPSGGGIATPAGRAVIRGRVVAADTGRPLARATVTAAATIDGRRQGGTISTDGEGRFELVGLPAGRYGIVVRRAGYLDTQYGQRFPRERAALLDVGEADVVDLNLRLPRASVISGRITDETGQPIANAFVVAVESRESRAAVTNRGRAITDADGEYRLAGLLPGTYTISAGSSDQWTSADDDSRVGYAQTYFPGSTSILGATGVSLGVGEQAAEINVALMAGRLATVSGTAFDSQGAPLQGLMLLNEDLSSSGSGPMTLGGDGTFRVTNVRPGRYTLRGGARGELVTMPLEISGADIEGVSIRSAPGWSVTGTVVVDSHDRDALEFSRVMILTDVQGQHASGPELALNNIRVVSAGIVSVSGGFVSTRTTGAGAPASARPDREGRFRLTSVFGPSRLRVSLPPGWVVTSLTADGSSLLDRVLDYPSGAELPNVQIVITNRTAAVSGRLVDAAGDSVSSGTVIVFSDDPSRWSAWTGAVRETQPDRTGAFRIDGLPPGRYAVAAVEFVETGQWFEPTYLQSLLPRAERLTVAPEERREDVTVTVSK